MGKHTLDGGVTVDVAAVEGSFGTRPPVITGVGRERIVSFSKPENTPPMATIKFRFKATGQTSNFTFGVKQICTQKSFQGLYVGLKDDNGSISQETKGFDDVRMLDLASKELRVLFDANNFATGATAFAPQAPFYSDQPVAVTAGRETELSVSDHPGANFRSELQNGTNDRPNYIDRVRMSSEFVTALVAVQFKSNIEVAHIPIEGVRWAVRSFTRVNWNGNDMTLEQPKHEAVKLADLPSLSDSEFDILRNKGLTAADCITQKFNDGLFSAQGAFKQQDYKHPTQRLTTIGAKGVIYIQFPLVAN